MNYQGLQIMEQKNAVLRSLKMLIEHMSAETLRGLSVLAFLEPYDLQASSLQTSFLCDLFDVFWSSGRLRWQPT